MGISAQARLTPAMSSRKLLVKGFIERFFAEHGVGPSLSEIAAATCPDQEGGRRSVRKAIRSLAKDGLIEYWPGIARGVRPVGGTQRALELLRAAGWIVNDDDQAVAAPTLGVLDFTPEAGLVVTKRPLPRRPVAGHDRPGERADEGQASDGARRDKENRRSEDGPEGP
ncbi:MAG: hypothetical protein U5M50_10480 [Sphingobium sp.]|nr:hypothetical protein [Sphingobium sp.]